MSAICDAHKKKVDVELLYNSVQNPAERALRSPIEQLQLEIRCGRESQNPERLGPQAPG